jgi:arylsulfatase A
MTVSRREFVSFATSQFPNLNQLNNPLTVKRNRKPNIVILLCDDLGYGDAGYCGHQLIRTPHIDRLAGEGVRLEQCYAAPTCTPSRAALLTGRYPLRSGLTRVLIPREHFGIPDAEITLAETLREAGYRTSCIGKWHLGDAPRYRPNRHGFDYFYGILYSHDMTLPVFRWPPVKLFRNEVPVESPIVQKTMTQRFTTEAIRFIRDNKDAPFFLYMAYTMPHLPWIASEQFLHKSAYGLYGDVVEEIDWSVGQIMNQLRALGLDEDTFILFTSDNGPEHATAQPGGSTRGLRGAKGTCWEGGVRVPCVVRWKGRLPASAPEGICSLMDFYPTICNAVGLPLAKDLTLDGLNLLPFLAGFVPCPRTAFAYYHQGLLYALRSEDWKVHFLKVPVSSMPGTRFRNPVACKPPELYNLASDRAETENVAREHPDVVERLTALAAEYRASIAAGRPTPSRLRSLLPGKRLRKGSKQ